MKRNLSILTILLCLGTPLLAQPWSPLAFQYQAALRGPDGHAIDSLELFIRVSILEGSTTGTVLYEELHTATALYGLFSLQIGRGGWSGGTYIEMLDIPWESGTPKFLRIEAAEAGGADPLELLGVQELLTVPLAQYATHAGRLAARIPSYLDLDQVVSAQLVSHKTWEVNGHTYALYALSGVTDWFGVNELCRLAGGHMLTITSAAENQFLIDHVYSSAGWIPLGYTDVHSAGNFQWITGEVGFDRNSTELHQLYTNWDVGEPNNMGGNERFAHVQAHSARTWNDVAGSRTFSNFIVEFSNGLITP